jgi:hypothetical protein
MRHDAKEATEHELAQPEGARPVDDVHQPAVKFVVAWSVVEVDSGLQPFPPAGRQLDPTGPRGSIPAGE